MSANKPQIKLTQVLCQFLYLAHCESEMSAAEAQTEVVSQVKKKSIFGRLAGSCSRHGSLCLAIITVLTITLVVLLVYYRGVWILGPYAVCTSDKRVKSKKKPSKKQDETSSRGDGEDEEQPGSPSKDSKGAPTRADDETERLIDAIQS